MKNTKKITQQEFEANEVLCDSMLFRLIQISENSLRLSVEFKTTHNDIPWQSIKGMRNRIVHEYGDVDFGIVYQTITEDMPEIYEKLLPLTW